MSKRGDYFYSTEQLLAEYRPGETQKAYLERTGIDKKTIYRRFGRSIVVAHQEYTEWMEGK